MIAQLNLGTDTDLNEKNIQEILKLINDGEGSLAQSKSNTSEKTTTWNQAEILNFDDEFGNNSEEEREYIDEIFETFFNAKDDIIQQSQLKVNGVQL